MHQHSRGCVSLRASEVARHKFHTHLKIGLLVFFFVNMTELPVEAGNNGEVIEPGAGQQRKCFALKVTAINALSHDFEAVKV